MSAFRNERIFILSQLNSVSLNRHIAHTYRFDSYRRGFVQVLAAQQTFEGAAWYQGTADAVRQNEPYIISPRFTDEYVLILASDDPYRWIFLHHDFSLNRWHWPSLRIDIVTSNRPLLGQNQIPPCFLSWVLSILQPQ